MADSGKKGKKGANVKKNNPVDGNLTQEVIDLLSSIVSQENTKDEIAATRDLYDELETEVGTSKQKTCITMPVIPLRDIVVFPNAISPLFVGRSKSVQAAIRAIGNNRKIFLVSQKDSVTDDVATENLEKVGVVGTIIQYIRLPDDTLKILVDATNRASAIHYQESGDCIEATLDIIESMDLDISTSSEAIALVRTITIAIHEYAALSKRISADMLSTLDKITNPNAFADIAMSYMHVDHKIKQEILEIFDLLKRLERVCAVIMGEVDILRAERVVQERVKSQIDKTHKEYYLNEQIKAIRRELTGDDEVSDSIERYRELLAKKNMPTEARNKAAEEIKRLSGMSSMSAENVRSYLDWMFALPWEEYTECHNSIDHAMEILNKSHYGLDKIKESILEYLAVQQNNPNSRSPILCLYGPPGVGKTSLGRAIADAMGRKYAKIALGGVRDEAEIRGHRRTYVGAMPGKIIQTLKRVGTSNPVILLDEIEKMNYEYRGDPSSALLEALDPEQNKEFSDHYMEIGYDLSKVMFIATANTLDMQRPLLDRLEIIKIPSYLEEEKVQICKQYIIQKQLEYTGITKDNLSISDDAVRSIIRDYTRESGVRELERLVGKATRKVLMKLLNGSQNKLKNVVEMEGDQNSEFTLKYEDDDYAKEVEVSDTISPKRTLLGHKVRITQRNIDKFLGIKKYNHSEGEKRNLIGVTHGLAYTDAGGDVLLIEAVKIPNGKGEVRVTGKLGTVMTESAQASVSYIKSNCYKFGINAAEFNNVDIHIHVPEGATPKDGPSAGVTICTTLVSLFSNIPVKCNIAMTGEITLRGRVLPIGGLREKMVASLRNDIRTVIIPLSNKKDLEDIPDHVKNQLKIVMCDSVEEVISAALSTNPLPIVHHHDIRIEDNQVAQVVV